jgi:hypothetical protein
MTKPKSPWKRGSMTFSNIHTRPRDMPLDTWIRIPADKPRIWTSKSGELPSDFIIRILKDMEADGAYIVPYLREGLNTQFME